MNLPRRTLYHDGKWICSSVPFRGPDQRRHDWIGPWKCNQYGAGLCFHRNLSVGNSGRRACHIVRICVCDGLLHVLHDWRGPQGQSASAMDPEAVFAEWGYDPQCSQYRHPRSSHHSAYECIQHCAEQLYPPLWV